jgi:hypothetical protein
MHNNPFNTLLHNLLSVKPRNQLPARVGGTREVVIHGHWRGP